MARNIGMGSDATVYRAVITTRYDHKGRSNFVTRYQGPYETEGAAQGQVTNAVTRAVDYDDNGNALPSRASGYVEQGSFTWTRVPEGGK